jgi:hypothetical protein
LQGGKRHAERLGPGNDYIIIAEPGGKRVNEPQRFFQAPANPVAPDRSSAMFADRKAKPRLCIR